MVPFAIRTLLHDKIRLVIAVGGVAFAVMLILVLRGIMDGTIAKTTVYIDKAGADIFVSQAGVENMALATSVLPSELESAVQQVPGVADAKGIVSVPVVLDLGGTQVAVRLIGYDVDSGLGGPWRLASGSAKLGANDIVMDSGLAGEHGLKIGDSVEIGPSSFRIIGLSQATNSLTGSLVFMSRDSASNLVLGSSGIVNFVLVKVVPGSSPAGVAAAIQAAVSDVTVQTRGQLSHNERNLLSSLFITPVNVMATIGFLVGMMVVGLTVYTAATERLRDFGVLKAIGASNSYLYGVVIRQALSIGLLGFVVGVIGQAIAKPIIETTTPSLGIRLNPIFAGEVLALALVMSLVSAFIPVYRVAALDPRRIFQA